MKVPVLFVLVALIGCIQGQTAPRLIQFGTYIGDFLLGACKAFQENIETPNTDSTCYKSCVSSRSQIITAFTLDNYNGAIFNMGDFNNFMQVFYIKFMDQMDKCSYNNFLMTIDNRLSNLSFLGGMVTKLVVETVQKYAFNMQTPTFKSFELIADNFKDLNMESVGKGFQLLTAKLVNYISPYVKTDPTTY